MPTFSCEAGMSTVGRSIATALRIRVSMSAIGSVIIKSPACLLHAGNQPVESHVAKTQPAHLDRTKKGAGPAAHRAPPLAPATELRRPVRFFDLCLARHELVLRVVDLLTGVPYSELIGRPSSLRSARASSSVWA